jgi:hypothetical protein
MRANRRRQRRPDPLAHPEAIRTLLVSLRQLLPDIIPSSEKQLIKMLNAVRNIERRPTSDTRRGRPSRWRRDDLLRAANHLRYLLERETQGRISLNSFIGLYLRVLIFPPDIQEALIASEINLFEAAQLARLTPERIGVSSQEARSRRTELLRAHLMGHGSQSCLMARVNEQLGAKSMSPNGGSAGDLVVTIVDDLLELDPYDTRHLFWEELRRISFALRMVTPDDIDEKILDDFLSASDHLSGILARIERRRQQREGHSRLKLQI